MEQRKQRNLAELQAIYQDIVGEKRYQEGKQQQEKQFGLQERGTKLQESNAEFARQKYADEREAARASAESEAMAAAAKDEEDRRSQYFDLVSNGWAHETAAEWSGYAGPPAPVEEIVAAQEKKRKDELDAAVNKELAIYGGKANIDIATAEPRATAEARGDIAAQGMKEQAGQAFSKDAEAIFKLGDRLLSQNAPLPQDMIDMYANELGVDMTGYNQYGESMRKLKQDELKAAITLKKSQAQLANTRAKQAAEQPRSQAQAGGARPLTQSEQIRIFDTWRKVESGIDKAMADEIKKLEEKRYQLATDEKTGETYYVKRDPITRKEVARYYHERERTKALAQAWQGFPFRPQLEALGMSMGQDATQSQQPPGNDWEVVETSARKPESWRIPK